MLKEIISRQLHDGIYKYALTGRFLLVKKGKTTFVYLHIKRAMSCQQQDSRFDILFT